MKKWNWASFIIGVITGAALMFGIGFFGSILMMSTHNSADNLKEDLVMLQEGEVGAEIKTEGIKIIYTKSSNIGIAIISEHKSSVGHVYGTTEILYIAPENERVFDGQEIEIPQGKKLMQVGTYKYGGETLAATQIK